MNSPQETVREVSGLTKHFPLRGSSDAKVRALTEVSFSLGRGEVLGLVGESGCGKSTLARCLMQLEKPEAGSVRLLGRELVGQEEKDLRVLRRPMQMVFQDPYASLNPRMRVQDILEEPLKAHRLCPENEIQGRIRSLMDRVGLPSRLLHKYPHEFSGGQRQRIAIARALVLEPRVLIADEPVSALDVSIQAQILNLLQSLVSDLGLSLVFIAHDLSVVRHVSDRISVMYLGRIIETGPASAVIDQPLHPYTQALTSAIPIPDPALAHLRPPPMRGEPPSPINPPGGCAFHPRCPRAIPSCSQSLPSLQSKTTDHLSACPVV